MLKVEMVRCFVTSPSPQQENPEGENKQVRYIPKDIYRLWKFLMVNSKGFTVSKVQYSLWVDDEMYSREASSYGEHEKVRVVQVYFRYFKTVEGGRPVIRYFPNEYFNDIIQFFMRNFSSRHIRNDAQKTLGYYIEQH